MSILTEFFVVLIISLGISLFAYITLRRFIRLLDRIVSISPIWLDRAFACLALIYTLTFSTLSVLQFVRFNTDGYDLAVFDQQMWTSLHGDLLRQTIIPDAPFLLGRHFSPILLAFVPLYAIWSSPIVLLIGQTIAITAAAFPIYWFARTEIGRPLAFVVAGAFFLYPVVQHLNLFEFHEIALAVPILAYATFFLMRRRDVPFLILLGLLLLVKEEVAFVVIAFGVFILVAQRRLWLGLGVALFGAIAAVVLLQVVIPYFSQAAFGSGYYYFGSGIGGGYGRYEYLGRTLPEVLATALTRPDVVLQHVLTPAKLEYALSLFAPLAFLPFAGIEVIILLLPTLAISLLSEYALQFSIKSYYPAAMLSSLFFATVVGVRRILRWRNTGQELAQTNRARVFSLGVFLLGMSIGSYYLQAPGPFARSFDPATFTPDARTATGYALLRTIPDSAIPIVQSAFLPQFSNRWQVYGFPTDDVFCQVDYLFGDTTQYQYTMFSPVWKAWLDSGYFEIVSQQEAYLLARRKASEKTTQIHFEDLVALNRYSAVPITTLPERRFLCVTAEWEAKQKEDQAYRVEFRLVDSQGHVWSKEEQVLIAGQSRLEKYTLAMPPVIPAGDYVLAIGVRDLKTGVNLIARDGSEQSVKEEVDLTRIHIEKDSRSYTASQLSIPVKYFVDMGEMRFLGYAPPRETIRPGELLQVGVYWRAREKPRGDYVVAVQLRDASGRVAFEQASRPANGTYPTTQWGEGEVLLDWHDVELPKAFAAGEYQIVVVLHGANDHRLGEAELTLLKVIP